MEYTSKTEHYQKVKKPLLERQRRARMNKCLNALKNIIVEFQGNDAILRMDKAEMLESTINFMKTLYAKEPPVQSTLVPMQSFRNGYMNAVNEVSRVLASTPGMSTQLGKSVMTHLGFKFNQLQAIETNQQVSAPPAPAHAFKMNPLTINTAVSTTSTPSVSPASSGYHSDMENPKESSSDIYVREDNDNKHASINVWRPWV